MPSLATISRAENLRRSSRPGFGTRLFCRPIGQHTQATLGVQLTGISNVQAFNVATNPVRSSHMESPGGFIETFRGLRDAGEIGFEANLFPDGQSWQRIDLSRSADLYTVFDDLFAEVSEDAIYEMWVVPPRSTSYVWLARGYPSVGGPAMYEMEGVMRMMMSFKVSGQPLQLYPIQGPTTLAVDAAAGTIADQALAAADQEATNVYRARWVRARVWEEWSAAQTAAETPADLAFTTPVSTFGDAGNGVGYIYREGGEFSLV